ncbi:glycosyltransferase family 39 protein [Melaminivora sp.]|uniref:glycosyltransferase family 39 protein n=1 Tax=Melaminivora sp. TaxID=1933032 RepID=UPI0028A7EA0A|nr:glycosyltransferase family 39 protein [Melaminivora sp.]
MNGPAGLPAPAPWPRRLLLAAAALYLLAWTLLPAWLAPSFPLDVVESLAWGREWQWGYYKHPPLAPWVLHLSYRAFGSLGPYLLSQLCIAGTLWFVWCTGRRLVSRERALLGTLLTLGVAFYSRPALEFNHNIAQMPLWAGLGWALLAAVQNGRARYWAALGALAGLGLLTKYSIGIVLLCLALYLVAGPDRRLLAGRGPWLALALALALLALHLLWLWQSDWLPMAYAGERSASHSTHPRLAALGFLGTQALNHLPLALIVLVALWRTRRPALATRAGGRWRLQTGRPGYLLLLALGPGLLVTLLGLLLGIRIRDLWGMPMWAFSGLLVAAWLPGHRLPALRAPLLRGLLAWLALATLLSLGYLAFGAQWRQRPARTDWPQQAIAAQAGATWSALSRCPLDVVAGSYWLAGLAAVPHPDTPSVLIPGDARYSPWVSAQRLATHGALWIREDGEPPLPPAPLDALSPDSGLQVHEGRWQFAWPWSATAAPLQLHWRAWVPAACVRTPGG